MSWSVMAFDPWADIFSRSATLHKMVQNVIGKGGTFAGAEGNLKSLVQPGGWGITQRNHVRVELWSVLQPIERDVGFRCSLKSYLAFHIRSGCGFLVGIASRIDICGTLLFLVMSSW